MSARLYACHFCKKRVAKPGRVRLDITSPGDLPDVRYRATVCSVGCLVSLVRSAATDYRRGMRRTRKTPAGEP